MFRKVECMRCGAEWARGKECFKHLRGGWVPAWWWKMADNCYRRRVRTSSCCADRNAIMPVGRATYQRKLERFGL